MNTQQEVDLPSNGTAKDRVNRMVDAVRDLVEGTHAELADVSVQDARSDTLPVTVRVTWTLRSSELNGQTFPGLTSIPGAHFGQDLAGFQREAAKRQCADTDAHILDAAAAKLRSRGIQGLNGDELIIRDFGVMSVNQSCAGCSGQGSHPCYQCTQGWMLCSNCGGRGYRDVSQWDGQAYRHTSESCGCSAGRVWCSYCRGAGQNPCSPCSGTGGFTQRSHIQVKATVARRAVALPEGACQDEVVAYLAKCPTPTLHRLVSFERHAPLLEPLVECGVTLAYSGTVVVTVAEIALKERRYTLVALGDELLPIAKPPLFDHLLSAELAEAGASRRRRPASVLRDQFEQLRQLRMPARAMELQAEGRSPADAIAEASDGYISPAATKALRGALAATLDAVSPRYAALPWVLLSLPAIAVGLVGGAVAFKMPAASVLERLTYAALAGMAAGLVMVAAAPVAAALSRLAVTRRQRVLPKPLRQRTASFAPFKAALAASVLAVALGAGLQVATGGSAPGLQPLVAGASRLGADLIQRFAPAKPTQLPMAAIDPVEMTRQVQTRLILIGYLNGANDGKLGPKTRRAMARYARVNGLPESAGVAEIYAHMGQDWPPD